MNEQVNYAKIQRIQDDLEALTIGQFGTGFVTDAMLYESGIKNTVASHTSQLVEITNYGTKANRPITDLYPGRLYFATDLSRRIEYNGYLWQYFDGLPVDTVNIADGNIYATSKNYTTQTLAGNVETVYQTAVDMTKDLILYTKLKLNDADDYFNINFTISATMQFQVSFGYNWATITKDGSSISIHDSINSSNTLIGSMDLYTTSHEVILWYDHKWGYLNVYVDNTLKGSWKPSSGANISGVNTVYGKAGSTATLITLDYWYMGMPLVTAIGDSITAGAIYHAPNPDYYVGVDNYSNNYPKMLSDYLKSKNIKNYFVVNKGVNGETSDQIKARFTTDIVSKSCKYVFIHGGINDHSTHHDVNITTQNKIDMANTAIANSIAPIILGVIPSKTSAPDITWQFAIDLNAKEKISYNAFSYVNLWRTIENPSIPNTADDSKLDDTVHPNLAGYTAMKNEIIKFIVTQ